MPIDRIKRSFVKALTYRALMVAVLALVSWVITGNVQETASITIVFHSVAIVTYTMHERLWERLKWGRKT